MAHLIDKDALVAEIEKLIDEIYAGRPFDSLSSEQQTALWYVKSIMSLINTLEVKEVKKEPISKVWHDASERPNYNVGKTVIVGYNNDDDLYDECNNVAYYITLSIFVSRKDLNTKVVRWAYLKDLI